VRSRNSNGVVGEFKADVEEEVVTTDLAVLQQKISSLNDLWDWGVLDYTSGASELKLGEADYAAFLYFHAVSALEKFDAEYVLTKAAIKRNFCLALRLSGLSRLQLEELARKSERGV
jgi:hypothetical protein